MPCGYYVIDKNSDGGRETYRIWQRLAGLSRAALVGEHRTLEAAKASIRVAWRDAAAPGIEAWAFGEPSVHLTLVQRPD